MDQAELIAFARKLEAGAPADQCELLTEAFEPLMGPKRTERKGLVKWHPKLFAFQAMLRADAYESAAMMLLPKNHTNFSLFGWGNRMWGCSFNDEDQQMGELAASKQIARMIRVTSMGDTLDHRPEPFIKWEKAIAQHWMEFYSRGAKTPALAIAAAAALAKAGIDSDTMLDAEIEAASA